MTPEASERTLLYVFAHPDDESYGVAGSIVRYAGDGRTRVAVATLTRGEASRHRRTLGISADEFGRRRAAEVREALAVLGCEEHYQYGYPDSGMRQVDPRDVERELRELIARVDPDVLATFDITGISGHPDHHVTAACVTRAFLAERDARSRPRRLAYYGVLEEDVRRLGRPIHAIRPENIHVKIDCRGAAELRDRALDCHESVRGDIERDRANGMLRRDFECYTLYGEPQPPIVADDLFAGL